MQRLLLITGILILVSACGRTALERADRPEPWQFFEEVCTDPQPTTQVGMRIAPSTLRAIASDESNGDDVYLVMIGFRSTFGEAGSTRVRSFPTPFREVRANLQPGQEAPIPTQSLPPAETGLDQLNIANGFRSCLVTDFFGALIIAIDNDKTSDDRIEPIIERVESALETALVDVIEGTSPNAVTNGADLESEVEKAAEAVSDAAAIGLGEGIGLFLTSGFNPDDVLGYHLALGFPSDSTVLRALVDGQLVSLPLSSESTTIFSANCRGAAPCPMAVNVTNPITGDPISLRRTAHPMVIRGDTSAVLEVDLVISPM
ncbi:MAG: hypothetical protein ACPGID_03960 [Rubricella sp.]